MSTHRHKRYDRTPVLGKDGKPIEAKITPLRHDLMRFLLRVRYATHQELQAYLQCDPDALYDTLMVMRASNNAYIRLTEHSLRNKKAICYPNVYELDENGLNYLRDFGETIPKRHSVFNMPHELLADHIMGSIEAGVRQSPDHRLMPWEELLLSERMPSETKKQKARGIDTAFVIEGETYIRTMYADKNPFAIETKREDRLSRRFMPGPEADTGSETVKPSQYKYNSVYVKCAAWISIERNQTYTSHFGFPNFYIPFVTTSEKRRDNIITMVEHLGGSKSIIFAVARDDASPGYLFTEDWLRAGHSPINLSK